MYTQQVIDHYENPRNVGTIKDADGVGIVGTPASGHMMKLTIKVSETRIIDAKFKTFGCAVAIAASSVITELIKGLPIEDTLKITHRQVEEALGGLPQDKLRHAILAEKVLKAAIHDYISRINAEAQRGG
jgi:nitrogen fixation NifU-like protein